MTQHKEISEDGPVVGLDASRNRSGGARGHLVGILNALDPRELGISSVHVWSYAELLAALPDAPWLVKHSPPVLERSLLEQLWWQKMQLPEELADAGCDILLSTDAGTMCRFKPAIVMSRDMLSFEPGEIDRFGFGLAKLRLWLLQHVQVHSLRHAEGALFLTQYAADVIRQFTGPLDTVRVIPHGIADAFRREGRGTSKRRLTTRCIYVSNADNYKHQWHVIEAVSKLRHAGYDVSLRLLGGAEGRPSAVRRTKLAAQKHDPDGTFISIERPVPHGEVGAQLKEADLFVFASSCENMPNTLIEAMAAGMPIACSNRGPMPEVLQDGGLYFDPEDTETIAAAIRALIDDGEKRATYATRAAELALAFSWARCAQETWHFALDLVQKGSEATALPVADGAEN